MCLTINSIICTGLRNKEGKGLWTKNEWGHKTIHTNCVTLNVLNKMGFFFSWVLKVESHGTQDLVLVATLGCANKQIIAINLKSQVAFSPWDQCLV